MNLLFPKSSKSIELTVENLLSNNTCLLFEQVLAATNDEDMYELYLLTLKSSISQMLELAQPSIECRINLSTSDESDTEDADKPL